MNQSVQPMMAKGCLYLICGPSGVGKDSLMAEVMRQLAPLGNWHQPQRHITRPADAGGEDHIAVSQAEFVQRQQQGEYPLNWQAHGLFYGIHRSDLLRLQQGTNLLLNVSRTVIEQARQLFPNRRIIYITARTEVLMQRLAKRGREDMEQQAKRLARANSYMPLGEDVWVIDNSGSLELGVRAFKACLHLPMEAMF